MQVMLGTCHYESHLTFQGTSTACVYNSFMHVNYSIILYALLQFKQAYDHSDGCKTQCMYSIPLQNVMDVPGLLICIVDVHMYVSSAITPQHADATS